MSEYQQSSYLSLIYERDESALILDDGDTKNLSVMRRRSRQLIEDTLGTFRSNTEIFTVLLGR